MVSDSFPANRRLNERVDMKLRVDAKYLKDSEGHSILEGEGFPDLGRPSLARRNPRAGMVELNTEDLSLSGLGLEGDMEFQPGMAFALDLHLPNDPVVVKALAEVMWVDGSGGKPRAGLRIAAINWLEMLRLERLVSSNRDN